MNNNGENKMKKVLMTWYGITDLKASLGLEFNNGPILSALLAEEYTDILILGYTNKDKAKILHRHRQHGDINKSRGG